VTPSFVAMAVYILGRCGYTPHQVKYETPVYEIHQIMHAHLYTKGVGLDWAHYDTTADTEITKAFERLKDDWEHRKARV